MSGNPYITITGFDHYYGQKPLAIGQLVILTKEPGNSFDDEAVRVDMPFINTVGYVANSPNTKADGTISAGRLLGLFEDTAVARVSFRTRTKVIAEVLLDKNVIIEVSTIISSRLYKTGSGLAR